MKPEKLFRILGQLDESLIESAEIPQRAKARKAVFLKVGAMAACTALVIGVGAMLYQNNTPPAVIDVPSLNGEDGKLPLLSVDFDYGSMGFEGYCAYNVDELVNENPWNKDSKITHLPVFKNALTYNELQRVDSPDLEAMKVLLKKTASKLGLDAEHLPITDDVPDAETKKKMTEKLTIGGGEVPEGYFDASAVFMETPQMKVEVDSSMVVTVHFEPAVALPKELNFTHNASYEDVYKVAEYLQKEYKDYIGMVNPNVNITGGDYTFDGAQMYDIAFFDDNDDETQRLLNYNFNNVTFACDDEGKLFISRVFHPDLTNVIGNYPIISTEQALQLLENKNYITSVPEEFPGSEYVKKVELIYRNASSEKTYMPYYRIYVELPSMKLDNGLNTYGAYYVPAVEGKYIENMPVWDGRFN